MQDIQIQENVNLLKMLLKLLNKEMIKYLKSSLRDYDQITKLNPWQTNLFLEIKKILDDHIKNISIA